MPIFRMLFPKDILLLLKMQTYDFGNKVKFHNISIMFFLPFIYISFVSLLGFLTNARMFHSFGVVTISVEWYSFEPILGTHSRIGKCVILRRCQCSANTGRKYLCRMIGSHSKLTAWLEALCYVAIFMEVFFSSILPGHTV